jgi:hypothetical protein
VEAGIFEDKEMGGAAFCSGTMMGTSFSSLLKTSNLHGKMDAGSKQVWGQQLKKPPAEALKPGGGAPALTVLINI